MTKRRGARLRGSDTADEQRQRPWRENHNNSNNNKDNGDDLKHVSWPSRTMLALIARKTA
jgi:hypothetical protein